MQVFPEIGYTLEDTLDYELQRGGSELPMTTTNTRGNRKRYEDKKNRCRLGGKNCGICM